MTKPNVPAPDPQQLSWQSYAPRYQALEAAPLSAEQVPAWLTEWSDLSREVSQVGALLSLRADLNTADQEAAQALQDFQADVMAQTSLFDQRLRQKLLAVPDYTPAPDFALAYRRMRDQAEHFREANVAKEVQHHAQMQRHAEITGAQVVNLDGQEVTIPTAESELGSPDRTRRQQVWEAMRHSTEAARGPLNDLMLDLIDTRRSLAQTAEVEDYRAYIWHELDRVDYTPQQCLDFHAAVRDEVVPLAAEIMRRKAEKLGLDTLRPWDYSRRTALDAEGRAPLNPFKTVDELETLAQGVFDGLDSELGAQFGQMRREGLLDLGSRPNKMSHAYCTSLEVQNTPFVVMNVVGTSNDLNVLLHEMGHAFHFFASAKAQPLIWNRWSPIEFIEIPSISMELLALDGLKSVYSAADLERVKQEQLESAVLFMPWAAQMDAFQHWLYTEAPAQPSIADLDAKWLELDRTFHPWIDWSGLDEGVRAGGWQYYHIFRAPFYYLEYAMCHLGALGMYRAAQADRPATMSRYKAALRLGNTVSVPELYRAAGLEFRFDREYVRGLMGFVVGELSAVSGEPSATEV